MAQNIPENLTCAQKQWQYDDTNNKKDEKDNDHPQSDDFPTDDLIQFFLYLAHCTSLKA